MRDFIHSQPHSYLLQISSSILYALHGTSIKKCIRNRDLNVDSSAGKTRATLMPERASSNPFRIFLGVFLKRLSNFHTARGASIWSNILRGFITFRVETPL